MADNNFAGVIESLMKGMNTVLSTKTVVGEATQIGDTIILPLVDVSFGVGACSLRHGGGRVWSVGEREECGRHERQDDAERGTCY